jgi:two-component system sensor histidine kinase KdpD
MAGTPRREHGAGLRAGRVTTGWVLAVTAPPALTTALLPLSGSPTPAFESLAFTVVIVGCALVGGLWPALTAAVLSDLLLNYYFTQPLHTLSVASVEDVATLVLFLLVAVLVASVVGTAARRSHQAASARQEADTLSMLNHTLLRGDHDVTALLGLVRETFGMSAASLVRRTGPAAEWEVVAVSGDDPPTRPEDGDVTADAAEDTRLVLRGHPVGPRDLRVLTAFATHVAVVGDRERLAERTAAAQRLEEGNRLRTALLAAVSHDLRTPLAGIKAAVSTLRTPELAWSTTDRDELLAAIEESCDRLGAIIANLLDMTRLQTGVVHLVSQSDGLEDVVARAVRALAESDRIDLDVPADLPEVTVDVGLLERVIANLVENALRHSPADQRVQVVGDLGEGCVRLKVTDHGPGVPEPARTRIFQPFQRLGDAPAGEGVGLGLAVAAGLSGILGGRIVPSTTPGGGLTMVLELPVDAARLSLEGAP